MTTPAQQRILDKPCILCDEPVYITYGEPYKSRIVKRNMCFICSLWLDYLDELNKDERVVFINNCRYTIGDETPSLSTYRGFGGRRFIIKYLNTNDTITTTNLWHNGEVPEHMQHMFPNTATFEPVTADL